LEAVHWPAVYGALLASAGRDTLMVAAWSAEHRPAFMPAEHARLTVLAPAAEPAALTTLIAAHGGAEDPGRVAGWLATAARCAGPLIGRARPRPVVPGLPAPVWVDPVLPALPLLGLALQWAERAGRLLVIRCAELPPGVAGHTLVNDTVTAVGRDGHRDVAATTVEIAAAGPAERTVHVWRHEFGHVVDPVPHGVRSRAGRERFADVLAVLLAARPPADLDQLGDLVDLAEHQVAELAAAVPAAAGPVTDAEAGSAGLTADANDLWAFLNLPLHPATDRQEECPPWTATT
jgi:hypothetical protein